MPEGPEIRRAADALASAVVGRRLRHVWFAFAELKGYEAPLVGHFIEAIEPRGKALLTRFDNGLTLYTHNQLYGVWRVVDAGKRSATNRVLRVALETEDRAILLYSATDISIWPTENVLQHPFLQRIGPDVLDVTLNEDGVAAQLADRRFARRQLGALLLDQAFLAGLGNYLRVEILWLAQLLPTRRPSDLDDTERAALTHALIDVPRRSYQTRGRRGVGHLQDTSFCFKAYQREGRPCPRCQKLVVKSVVSSRPFYFCSGCQH